MRCFGFLTFLAVILIVVAEDIKINDLNEAPGLLPISMGKAKLHDRYKTAMHRIDLKIILAPLDQLDQNWPIINKFMYHQRQLDYLDEKRKTVRQRLMNFDQFETRSKRFLEALLVAGISIIPGVISALNQPDTSQYDDVINRLEEHDQQISHINQEIMLFHSKIKQIDSQLNTIQQNQLIFEKKLVRIEKEFNERALKIEGTLRNVQNDIFNLNQTFNLKFDTKALLDDFENQLDRIQEMLQDTENAFTFGKLGIAHPSLFTARQLFEMIEDFNVHADQLMFPLSLRNINSFHSILNIRAYKKKTNLVFIVSMPIVKKETYDYYKMVPIPVRKGNSFLQVNPKKTYLLVNGNNFILSDYPCYNTGGMHYCKNYNTFATDSEMSCLKQIVMLENDYSKCKFSISPIHETEVLPISNDYFVAVAPQQVKLKKNCQTKSISKLTGTHLIYVPEGCSFTLGNSMHMNNEMDMMKINPVIPHPIDWEQIDNEDIEIPSSEISPKIQRLTSGSNRLDIDSLMMLSIILLLLKY